MNLVDSTWASSNKSRWVGRILCFLVIAFLVFDGGIKVMGLDIVKETMTQLGYPVHVSFGLGVITLLIAALYAIPRTSVLGAVLLTGLLGGAIATQLRVGNPLFSHILFGAYLRLIAWGGLLLRDARLRDLIFNGRTRRQ
jgi:hypothetical protein